MSTHNTRENFVRDLSESVRYFANVNQYPIDSDEQKAYLEGVQTAIAMMYIDLTGTPKSEGMLAKFLHQELQKAREEQNKHIGNQLLAYYENNVDPKGELKDKWFVKLVKNLADILVAPKDQSELDQPIS